ncbi:MAG: hypothetical protein IJP29_04965 [Lachnospiraceae bacterium]|nr:hypothetical protein [Lachnospiraceae bacterium]
MHYGREKIQIIIAYIMTILLAFNLLSGVKHGAVVSAEESASTVASAVAVTLSSVDGVSASGDNVDKKIINGSKVELAYAYDTTYTDGTYSCKYTLTKNDGNPSEVQSLSSPSGTITIENPVQNAGEDAVNCRYTLDCWAENSAGEMVSDSEVSFSFVLGTVSPSTELSVSGSIVQNTVTVTYQADRPFDGETYTAYRKVVQKADEDLSSDQIIADGEIALGNGADFASCESSEDFTNTISTNEDNRFAIEDGDYEVTFWLEDSNGQIVGSLQTKTFTIDSEEPEVTLVCTDNDKADKEKISCTLTVVDDDFDNCDVVVNVKCEGVTTTTNQTFTKDENGDEIGFDNSTATLTFTEEGKYTISATATDEAGNSVTTDEITFYIDRTEPVLSIMDDEGNELVPGVYSTKTGMNLIFSVVERNFELVCDDSNDCAITYQKMNGDWKTINANWVESSEEGEEDTWKTTVNFADYAMEDGVYYLAFYVTDVSDNDVGKSVRITVDNTAVSIEELKVTYEDKIFGSPNTVTENSVTTYYLKDTAKVSFKIAEENGKATAYVDTKRDGVSVDNKTIEITADGQKETVTYSDEGSYVTSVYGKDNVGNEGEKKEICYVVDKTLPVPSILQVKNGTTIDIAENQLFAGSDNLLRFVVKEDYHDLSQYTITVNLWKDGSFWPQNTTLSGDAITWNTIAGTNEVYYENTSLFGEEGRYTVTLTAVDLAGNENSKQVSFYMDSTAPIISQKSDLENGAYYDHNVRFRYNVYEYNYEGATANITVSRMLDGQTYQTTDTMNLKSADGTYEYACNEEGIYTITVTAKDYAGNEGVVYGTSQKAYTISFTVDKTSPELSVNGIANGYMTKDAVTLNVQAQDRNHDFTQYQIHVSRSDISGELEAFDIGSVTTAYDVGNGWSTDGYAPSLQNVYGSIRTLKFDKEGIYKLTVTGKDLATNKAVKKTVSFTIDRTAPAIYGVTYSDEEGKLSARHNKIYSKHAILVEFSVTDSMVGVDKDKVYVTVGTASERTSETPFYVANQSLGNNYYVYIPTDLKVSEFSDSITIWASDLLGNETNLGTEDIIYKTSKATISMECDKDYSKWTNQDIAFNTKVTDDVAGLKKIVYKVNGKEVKTVTFKELTYSYEYEVVASESADKVTGYAVSVEVTNNCNTVQTAKRQVYIDKEKPVITLSGVTKNLHYPAAQSFQTTVSDVSYDKTRTMYYVSRTLDGKTSTMSLATFKSSQYEDNCNRKVLKEGSYKIYAIATDGAGNKKRSNTLSFVIDKTAPVVQVSGVANGSVHVGSVTLDFTCVESFFATNEVTIQIERTLDGEVSGTTINDFVSTAKKSNTSKSFTEDGTYEVTISAKDKAGNSAQPQTLTFVIDNTKPVIRIEGTDDYQMWSENREIRFVVEESYYSGNKVTITGTRTDMNGNVENVEVPAMSNSGKVSQLAYMFTEDGIYEFQVMSQDEAGNTDSKAIHFTIDKTAPIIQNVLELDGGYYQSFQIAESIGDVFKDLTVISYRILLNGVEYNGTDVVEEEGKYNLYIEVEDELGHTVNQMVEFIIDHTPPKVIFGGVQDTEVVTESGVVTLALTNTDDTIKAVRINGKEQSADMRSFTYTEYGAYWIEVDCEDRAGNAVTRDLHFVYTNPTILFVVGAGVAVIMVGVTVIAWLRIRKKEKEESKL